MSYRASQSSGAVTRIAWMLPDFAVGGGQVSLLNTLEALDGPEWDNVVIGFAGGPMLTTFRERNIRCEIVGNGRWRDWPAAVRATTALIRDEQIDVMLSFNTPIDRSLAQLCSVRTGCPVVVWFGSVAVPLIRFPPPVRRVPAFVKRLLLWPINVVTIRRVTGLVATTNAVARSFADHLRVPVERFAVVSPGLPDSYYDHTVDPCAAATLRAELGVGDGWPVLLSIGMLIPLKGQMQLIDALEGLADRFPDAHLLVVGEGPDRGRLEQRLAASPVGDRVHLLGRRDDVPDLLALSDGLLSASSSEGFGRTVLEAMAASRPVVAVRVPAFEDFVVDGVTAELVAAQDGRALADGIATVFSERERAVEMGVKGRQSAEDYRVGRRAAQLGDELRCAAAQRR